LNNVVSKFVNVTPLHNLSRSAIRSIQNPVGVVVIMFAKNIAPFIGTIVLKVLPLVTELVVVDDGSDDQTAEIATRAGALVLRQPKELGKFKTFYEGLRVAETFNPQAIIYVDGTYGFVDSDISTLSDCVPYCLYIRVVPCVGWGRSGDAGVTGGFCCRSGRE
jgi:hypothetical protein